MPGLPLMGIALMVISGLFLLPADATTRFRLLQQRLAVGVLVALVVSAILSLASSQIINAVMQTYDYHSCAVKHGRRMAFVIWAAGSDLPARGGRSVNGQTHRPIGARRDT
jgi:hypothetical protein